MSNIRLPIAVCAAVAEVLNGSHETLNALFETAGAPGPPPDLAHHSKWKVWLQRVGNDPKVDSLAVLGRVIEEFMDLPPKGEFQPGEYTKSKERLTKVLEEHGFQYFRGGRIIPVGHPEPIDDNLTDANSYQGRKPSRLEDLLYVIVKGLPRAMHPLTHRRKGFQRLSFNSEYDIQDLLHSQLRPWILDIRPEEFTPSYAGTSTRMDFLLTKYKTVIETKRVRDKSHATKLGDELIIDIEHYRRHTLVDYLWCVIYDPELYITNPSGIISDLQGSRSTPDGSIDVKVLIIDGSI